ncbi:MAG: TlpA family protein disulfide reductase [Chitinophagaceae bacterium]|nr:TlpA family protein disulfide reductase [Chitinophagaceae bacterium]
MRSILITVIISFTCNFVVAQKNALLANGNWRGVLSRSDGREIVINFEVKDSLNKKKIYIINAAERLPVDDITFKADSVIIILPFFDSQFRLIANQKNQLTGEWIKHLADRNVVIPFTATHNENYRFKINSANTTNNITGRWSATFSDSAGTKSSTNVGVFEQSGNKLTGSFLTVSGDYRYLEGVVDGDSLKLSGFDGGYALLFTAKINDDKTIAGGRFYSGAGPGWQQWSAVKNNDAVLPETASLLKPGISPKVAFTFKDVNGKSVSFSDKRFKNKVVVLQISGTWCPNCMDETRFLNEIYPGYKSKGVEFIALLYERTEDFLRSQTSAKNFIKRLHVAYPVLITPIAVGDPQRAEKTLPQLEKIPAFPTAIFVDRKGEIQKIHIGFSGPGTGEADYNKQKEEYINIIEGLLNK